MTRSNAVPALVLAALLLGACSGSAFSTSEIAPAPPSRLRAKQAEEQRYLALMARADKIDGIPKLDNVLAQTRTQIEQLTGQVNSIRTRTQYATIGVTVATSTGVTPPTPVTGWDPARSAALAVAALTALLRVAADVAIWAFVLGTLPNLTALVLWVVLRRRRRTALTPHA